MRASSVPGRKRSGRLVSIDGIAQRIGLRIVRINARRRCLRSTAKGTSADGRGGHQEQASIGLHVLARWDDDGRQGSTPDLRAVPSPCDALWQCRAAARPRVGKARQNNPFVWLNLSRQVGRDAAGCHGRTSLSSRILERGCQFPVTRTRIPHRGYPQGLPACAPAQSSDEHTRPRMGSRACSSMCHPGTASRGQFIQGETTC